MEEIPVERATQGFPFKGFQASKVVQEFLDLS